MWLAAMRGQPLWQVQEETPSSEFIRWCEWRLQEPNHFHREDHYFAQLCFEIFRSRFGYKDRGGLNYTAWLKKFRAQTRSATSNEPPTKEEVERRMLRSKAAWFGLLRIGEPKK